MTESQSSYPNMTNAELAETLNKKMRRDAISDLGQKPIPYLGWFWRDISDWEADALPVSLTEGHWWLDEASKWSYESKRLTEKESRAFLILSNEIIDKHIELMQILSYNTSPTTTTEVGE